MKAFLSHSSADKESYVGIVASRLTDEDIVYDEVSFEFGEQTINEIIRGLDESTVFCLFISNKSLDSEWVRQEIDGASVRLASGSLKYIYPIVIDRGVAHDDPRIPKWLRENYNLRLVTRPVIAARRIQQKLRQASWAKHPKIRERERAFVGRNKHIEAFERRFDDYSQPKPVLSVVGGPPSIGRRTLILNALRKLALTGPDKDFPVLPLDRHASIEDFILRLLDLGASDASYADLNLTERLLDEKVAIAVGLLKDLATLKERVIVLDEGCLVTFERKLAPWFEAIVSNADLAGKPLIFIASRWAPNPGSTRHLSQVVFSCTLGELDPSERRRLFARLLEIEEIALSNEDFEAFADLLHGFPDEVFFAVDLVARFGVRGALDRSHEIVEFNGEKASMLLRPFQENEAVLNVIRLLAQSEIFSVEFLCQVFKEDQLVHVIGDLVSEHVCELIGAEGEFVRLVDSVRDYVKRNDLSLAPELREAVNTAIEHDIQHGNWNEYDSSRVAFLVKNALASGQNLEPRLLIPSHILRTIKELYYDRGSLRRAVELADVLLAKERNLDPQLVQDVRYYLCLVLARLRDPRVLEEAQRIHGDEHHFILGYYYRLVGRQRDAIERLTRVVAEAFVGVRAKRELVEVFLQMEQYDEARELARKNYEENRTNQFHIHAYFRALVLGSNPEQYFAQLEELCAELEAVGSERSRQMAMIGRALISARCAHDHRSLDLIDDAIAAFPRVIYPVLAKFDIGLSFRSEADMQDALRRLETLANEGVNLSIKTLAVHRAYLAAVQGDLPTAQSRAAEVAKHFTDEARTRLLEKLEALAAGAPENRGNGSR
ncbi:toll/interleukin-1 receptor domain-containing protein [Azotobacter chroococcum]|uniref:toll/interleukin-1 receptor domain-containing protein n=1 Tax=Azotobacter chroococcum TaxID=353 RepID=UPI00103D6C8F|nr:toll/interleukin-1 receptor domain-containing protein [Azotobacter chroococcum]TBW33384.1 toll/interleukin-1 receptor domain-containing protein [Azotobacter chroococcum]